MTSFPFTSFPSILTKWPFISACIPPVTGSSLSSLCHFEMALMSIISSILLLFNASSETQLSAGEVNYGKMEAFTLSL